MSTRYLLLIGLAACNLGPRVSDDPVDAPAGGDAIVPDGKPNTLLLPRDSVVPSISDNPELINQIRINDGLSDTALMTSGGVITRSTGKSNGSTVRYWNFGPAPFDGSFPVITTLYVIGRLDTTTQTFTPLADHPPLIDTICGDIRYSAIRRVINVPITGTYGGELITSIPALEEALDRGLVGDPVSAGTWVNMPVVLPGTKLEVVDAGTPLDAKQVFAHGYLVDVFELGSALGRQPLRNGSVPIGQASGLQSGVTTGDPPVLSTAIDSQLVFQYTIPTVAPTMTPNYTPLATDVTVRLAMGVAPADISSDASLFKRSTSGSITGYLVNNVANYTINTTMNNLPIQFAPGTP